MHLLKYFSNEGDTCLDITMGSGSCGVACKTLERKFIGIELIKEHFDIAEKRLSIISIVHSHPDHPDKPSEFDRKHAWPGFSYIIISINKGNAVSYRSWQLNQDRTEFIEEKITIIKENKLNG